MYSIVIGGVASLSGVFCSRYVKRGGGTSITDVPTSFNVSRAVHVCARETSVGVVEGVAVHVREKRFPAKGKYDLITYRRAGDYSSAVAFYDVFVAGLDASTTLPSVGVAVSSRPFRLSPLSEASVVLIVADPLGFLGFFLTLVGGFVGVPGAAAGAGGVLLLALGFGALGGVLVEGDGNDFTVIAAVDVGELLLCPGFGVAVVVVVDVGEDVGGVVAVFGADA